MAKRPTCPPLTLTVAREAVIHFFACFTGKRVLVAETQGHPQLTPCKLLVTSTMNSEACRSIRPQIRVQPKDIVGAFKAGTNAASEAGRDVLRYRSHLSFAGVWKLFYYRKNYALSKQEPLPDRSIFSGSGRKNLLRSSRSASRTDRESADLCRGATDRSYEIGRYRAVERSGIERRLPNGTEDVDFKVQGEAAFAVSPHLTSLNQCSRLSWRRRQDPERIGLLWDNHTNVWLRYDVLDDTLTRSSLRGILVKVLTKAGKTKPHKVWPHLRYASYDVQEDFGGSFTFGRSVNRPVECDWGSMHKVEADQGRIRVWLPSCHRPSQVTSGLIGSTLHPPVQRSANSTE